MSDEYDALLSAEQVFLDRVCYDEIERLYKAVRGGDQAAFRRLTEIAMSGWSDDHPMKLREAKADRALQLLYWFKESKTN
jgi:hypothetical protein